MADDKLPCCRSESIAATRSDNVMSRPLAISLSPFQNASSRLTLVLWPAMTMERLTTGDFIARLLPLMWFGAKCAHSVAAPGAVSSVREAQQVKSRGGFQV